MKRERRQSLYSQIMCEGALHEISLIDNKLILHNHCKSEIEETTALYRLGSPTVPLCVKIWNWWKKPDIEKGLHSGYFQTSYNRASHLPGAIYETRKALMRTNAGVLIGMRGNSKSIISLHGRHVVRLLHNTITAYAQSVLPVEDDIEVVIVFQRYLSSLEHCVQNTCKGTKHQIRVKLDPGLWRDTVLAEKLLHVAGHPVLEIDPRTSLYNKTEPVAIDSPTPPAGFFFTHSEATLLSSLFMRRDTTKTKYAVWAIRLKDYRLVLRLARGTHDNISWDDAD